MHPFGSKRPSVEQILGFLLYHFCFLPIIIFILLPILLNPVPCGADGLLGDAHDAADGLIVHAHFIEDEKEKQALADCISKRFRTFAATNNIELCQSLPEHIRLNQAGIY